MIACSPLFTSWTGSETLPPPDEAGARAQAFLKRAMVPQRGKAPPLGGEVRFEEGGFALAANEFRFVTPGGISFHYLLGDRVIVEADGASSEEELQLYLWGTVFGAVAWLAGMVPLHASAVLAGGVVTAFTAPSGGGKSTLAAALAARGAPLVCDDTLVLAPGSAGPLAIPDGKPMKLREDALGLTGMAAAGPIKAVPGKYFARPPLRAARPHALRNLVVLERGDRLALESLRGSAKLTALADAFYRPFIHAARPDPQFHSQMMPALARSIDAWILYRPLGDDHAGTGLAQSVHLLDTKLDLFDAQN